MTGTNASPTGSLHCNYFSTKKCTSCALLDRPLADALAFKQRRLEELVRAHNIQCAIDPIQSPASIFPSRTKLKMAVAGNYANSVIGYVNSEHKVIELLDCPLHPPRLNALLHYLHSNSIPQAKLEPYDIEKRRGELKWIIIMSNHDVSEIILRFVLRGSEAVLRIRKIVPELQKNFPEIRVVTVNFQPLPSAILEGPDEEILTAEDSISEHYPTANLYFKPQSFIQVTYEAASALYLAAAAWAAGRKVDHALDLYCGSGGFLFSVANTIKSGIGIEFSQAAVDCAQRAREINNALHLQFRSMQVESFLEEYSGAKPDLLIVNPPRRGLSPKIIQQILRLEPEYIMYSSCNPDTLCTDLEQMLNCYAVAQMKPFDMFPLTEHIEVLTFLERRASSK